MQDLAQQPGQQRDKGHADQGNAAARDQLVEVKSRLEGASADDVMARLKAGARKGSAHATRRRWKPKK